MIVLSGTHAITATALAQGDDVEFGEQPGVHVFLYPAQEELAGPSPFKEPGHSWLGGLLKAFPDMAIAGLGTVVEGSTAMAYLYGEGKRLTDTSASAGRSFNFSSAIRSMAIALDAEASWYITDVQNYAYRDLKKSPAARVIEATDAEYVLFLRYTFYLSPGLDQVRLRADANAYTTAAETGSGLKVFDRHYEYLSPSKGNLFRAWHPGEKEALVDAIEHNYATRLARYPQNGKAYRKDRNVALNALNRRDVILPEMAISEGWPGDSMSQALRTASNELITIMRQDLLDFPGGKYDESELITFRGLDQEGKADEFKGYLVHESTGYTTYRDRKGNMYRLPRLAGSD